MRDYLGHINLEDMIDEIFPFTAEFATNMVTIMNEEDIIGTKFWSDSSLVERYHSATGRSPKLSKKQLRE
jgi:hypothetical protein